MKRTAHKTSPLNNPISWCFSPSGFNGKEKDYESGFHYYGARYYWSELLTGWLSVDPMMDKYPNISPYNYCIWNPVKLVDLDGKMSVNSIILFTPHTNPPQNRKKQEGSPQPEKKTSEKILSAVPFVLPVALADGPIPGPADAVAVTAAVGITVVAGIALTIETIVPWVEMGVECLKKDMSQHGKQRLSLSPEEVEKCKEVLQNPKSTKKERSEAKQKLKTHEKSTNERHSRQSKDKKTNKQNEQS